MGKLEVLRGFCLDPGKDVAVGDELDEAEVGQARADLLCSGTAPKCRRIPDEDNGDGGGDEVADDGPAPKTKKEKAAAKAAKKPATRVPGKLRHR